MLLAYLSVYPEQDDISIHPQVFCQMCHSTAKQTASWTCKPMHSWPNHVPFEWVSHSDESCSICEVRSKSWRPVKKAKCGRPNQLQQHIASVTSTVPHIQFSQVVDKTFIRDLTCFSCESIANETIEILPRKSLICT